MNAFISPLEALFILLILTTARSEIMNLAHKPFPWNPANIQQMPTWLVQMITITVKILILNNSHYIHKHTVYTKTPEIIIMECGTFQVLNHQNSNFRENSNCIYDVYIFGSTTST